MSPLDEQRDRLGRRYQPRRGPPVWQLLGMLIIVIFLIWYLSRFN
jgi:hypothetical protein